MSKFTFICQEEAMPFVSSVDAKRTVEFEAESLDQLLNEFEMFLRGCGFYFSGRLDVVPYDDNESEDKFDFSEIPQNNWPFKMEMPGTLGGAKVTFASDN
jgi:hypothetical protein